MADEQKAAVYVSWVTFKNAIEGLLQGVPNQIDRTTFPGFSGGVQSQLLAGMKFLGLITENDKPTATLNALVVAEENKRKEKLKEILQKHYADLFALDLQKTTPQELGSKMGESYNVTGDTKEKAIRFFLSAVAYVGIPVSRFLKIPGASSSSGNGPKRKRSSSRKNGEIDVDDAPAKTTGQSKVVTLKSGGNLTLAASVDFFQLSAADRAFVFDLIDRLDKYEKEEPTSAQ